MTKAHIKEPYLPIAYTIEEGGIYKKYTPSRMEGNHFVSGTCCYSRGVIHSLIFDNGWCFNQQVGWRKIDPERMNTIRKVINHQSS